MYCERCNVEFTEGLRYCKWCGQALADRPRVTSELHACPNCTAAVQPGWIFCKSCGLRLAAPVGDPGRIFCPKCGAGADAAAASCDRCGTNLATEPPPPAHEGHSTSVIGGCSSCGEKLDTGSMYCKACGAAVYAQARPFGGSALLCSACNSYSPVGSSSCRVCGAALGADKGDTSAGLGKTKPTTLPDLGEHLSPDSDLEQSDLDQVNSGANTAIFSAQGQGPDETSVLGGADRGTGLVGEKRAGGPGTNALPGVAGSKSEVPANTGKVPRTRITSSGEGDSSEERPGSAGPPSGESETVVMKSPFADSGVESPETVIMNSPFAGQPESPETVIMNSPFAGQPESPETVIMNSPFAGQPESPETVIMNSPFPSAPVEPTETVLMNSPFAGAPVESPAAPGKEPPPARPESSGRRAGSFTTREQSATISFAEGRPAGDAKVVPDIGPLPTDAPLDQAKPKKLSGVAIASVAVTLIVIGGAGYLVWSFIAQKGPTQRPPVQVVEPKTLEPPPPPAPPTPVAPAGMVMVKAGTYTIGREDGDPIEAPGHAVKLAAYFIDRTEVTNADYAKFVGATRHKPPANWKGGSYPEGRNDFPVTGVSWQDAADYAAWAGKRLPTEAEWEAAARGSDSRKYPWGNEWQGGFANIGLRTAERVENTRYPSGIAEVGKYPQGASPLGALDMIGNVWEWVADEVSLYPGSSAALPVPPDDAAGALRVIRGGAYDGDHKHDASYRGFLDGSLPYPKVGFRCAKSAEK